ncbi:glucokinase [soil metagenome]
MAAESTGSTQTAVHIAALDIGGTKMAATVAGPTGPIARVTQLTVKTGPPDAVANQAVALIRAAIRQAGIAEDQVEILGVSTCGPFAQLDGMLGLAAPNICDNGRGRADLPNAWDVIPLEKILRTHFRTVVIANDCIAALTAERSFGAVRDVPDCVYSTWSTGIGFGLCVDGHILRGKHGNAGHAGHLLMDPLSEIVCGCGNRGDLEALISGRGLAHRSGMSAVELFAAAKRGESRPRMLATEAARWFGRGLYNLAVTLDTRTFVVGGSVWLHHGEWLAPIVHQEIASRMPALTQGVSVLPAALGSLVTDVGAMAMVMPVEWVAQWRRTRPWESLVTVER